MLNETTVVTPSIWIALTDPITNSQLNRKLSLVQQNPLIIVPLSTRLKTTTSTSTSSGSTTLNSFIPHQEQDDKGDDLDSMRPHLTLMGSPLPLNVHLLTLRVMGGDFPPKKENNEEGGRAFQMDGNSLVYLLRLQHTFEVNEHPIYSNPVKVSTSIMINNNYIYT